MPAIQCPTPLHRLPPNTFNSRTAITVMVVVIGLVLQTKQIVLADFLSYPFCFVRFALLLFGCLCVCFFLSSKNILGMAVSEWCECLYPHCSKMYIHKHRFSVWIWFNAADLLKWLECECKYVWFLCVCCARFRISLCNVRFHIKNAIAKKNHFHIKAK